MGKITTTARGLLESETLFLVGPAMLRAVTARQPREGAAQRSKSQDAKYYQKASDDPASSYRENTVEKAQKNEQI